jgi:hypothetical protein
VRVGEPFEPVDGEKTDQSAIGESLTLLLRQIDEEIVSERLDAYETVLRGAESRNEKLQRLVAPEKGRS